MIAGATIAGAAIAGKTIAGATWGMVVGFPRGGGCIAPADSFMPGANCSRPGVRWLMMVGSGAGRCGFACGVAVTMGKQTASQFVAGYTIETSLSNVS